MHAPAATTLRVRVPNKDTDRWIVEDACMQDPGNYVNQHAHMHACRFDYSLTGSQDLLHKSKGIFQKQA